MSDDDKNLEELYKQAWEEHKNGNKEEAFSLLKESADKGHVEAQFNVGVFYENGNGIAENEKEAFKYYKLAADKELPKALFNVGRFYYNGSGVKEDKLKAFKYFESAANKGDIDAEFMTGVCYYNGSGVEENKAEAFKYCKEAADKGQSEAQFNIGLCYTFQDGTAYDKEEAFKYFSESSSPDKAEGLFDVASCYYNGTHIKEDKIEAFKYYKLAADNGHAESQFMIAISCYFGDIVNENKKEAIEYFIKSAKQGYAKSEIFMRIDEIFNKKTKKTDLVAKSIIDLFKEIKIYFDKTKDVTIDKLYHFLDADALKNILKKKDNNVLWVLDSIGMNDPREGRILLSNNNTKSALEFFYKEGEDLLAPESEDIHCFLTSFTEEKDSLGLWLAYGNDGKGFSIEIDPKNFPAIELDNIIQGSIYNKLQESSVKDIITSENIETKQKESSITPLLQKVKYIGNDTDISTVGIKNIIGKILKVKEAIKKLKHNITAKQKNELKSLVRSILAPWMFTFKDKSYEAENEWRLIYHIPRTSDFYRERVKAISEEIPSRLYLETDPILFKTNGDKKLSITIGPKFEKAYLAKHQIEHLLLKNGHDKVEVKYSEKKYR